MMPIAELLDELRAAAERANPNGLRPVLDAPRTREDAQGLLAEDRAEQRRRAS